MEFTFLNQICLLKNWNCVKFIQIMITMAKMMTSKLLSINTYTCVNINQSRFKYNKYIK